MPQIPEHFIEEIPLAEWAHLHSHLIWIYDGPVDPTGRVGENDAPHFTAWLLRKGQVELRIGKVRMQARAGDWIFPPPGKIWRRFSDEAQILSVRYRASWPSGEDLFSDGLGINLKASNYPELERTAKPLCAFVRRHFRPPDVNLLHATATLETHLGLQQLFSAWLNASVRALIHAGLVPARMGHIDERLLKAVWLLERHSLGQAFREQALAEQVGLSVSQLNRLFHSQFGVSSHCYYDRRRREQAIAALRSSSRTIKEIAYDLGFSSLPHFSVWTKRSFGKAPRELRRNSSL